MNEMTRREATAEMIERVARAIYVNEYDEKEFPWDTRVPAVAGSYRRDARAAIEAMREPTPAMNTEHQKVRKLCNFLKFVAANSGPIWRDEIAKLLAECSSVQTNSTEEHLTNETETETQQKQQEET